MLDPAFRLHAAATALGIALALAGSALAAPARTFRVTSYAEFDAGEAKDVLVSSLGEIQTGFATKRIELPAAFVRSAVQAPSGAVYLGTGIQGELWIYEHGKARKVVRLPEAVEIPALALGQDGTVYAGTTPGARIFAVKDGRARELAKLGTDHVWALAWDASRTTLYAGTGAQGKLFAINPKSGSSRVVWSTTQRHLRAILPEAGNKDAFWIGTGDDALLFRVTTDGKARAVYDFEGEEIRALAWNGSALMVAVNQFDKGSPPPLPSPPPLLPIPGPRPPMMVPPAPTPGAPSTKGKGTVYRVDPEGRVEPMHTIGDGYITALEAAADGSVLAATAGQGKVLVVKPDRTVMTAFDMPERQVLTLVWTRSIRLLGTGDAGALYEVLPDLASDAVYTSKVFDAEFVSRLGSVRWHGQGAPRIESRSGNTAKPDASWSGWERATASVKLGDGGASRLVSPSARYTQIRFFLARQTTIRDFEWFCQPTNQRPRVTEIQLVDDSRLIGPPPPAVAPPSGGAVARVHNSTVKLRWKVDNPDGDVHVYRLWFRQDGEPTWKSLGGSEHEPLTKPEFEWNTESVPDGNYVVRVVASDERSNPKELALEHELVSQPFLIDNRKPEIADLKVRYPDLSGTARDSFSPIRELAFSVDGGSWRMLAPSDGVLDSPVEAFSTRLGDRLPQGTHTLAVRATDAADNIGAAQVSFQAP